MRKPVLLIVEIDMEAVHPRQAHLRIGSPLDRVRLHPWIQIGRLHWPAWRFFVLLGILLGIFLIGLLGALSGFSFWVAGGVGLAAGLACGAYALFRKVLYGYENYTFYHYQFVVLFMGAVVTGILRLPLLNYLDLLAMGMAVALATGRLGCLLAGCCYGRPHRWGVCYREEHSHFGFPRHLLGVRLLPVQGIEALWLGIVIVVGVGMLLSGQPPGATLSWYLLAYSLGRFVFEFLRGDPPRPYWLGISEAQWTSALVLLAIVLLEVSGVLPGKPWHGFVLAATGAAIILLYRHNRIADQPTRWQLMDAWHIREIAQAVDQAITPTFTENVGEDSPMVGRALVARTSRGIQISGSRIRQESGLVHHYALSAHPGPLDQNAAHTIAGLVLQLRHPDTMGELHPGNHGVYHLLVRDVV